MQEVATKIVVHALTELNQDWENEGLRNPDVNTRLFGPQGNLDSLGLVALLTEIEERVYEELGVEVFLADDRAMSQSLSPFRSVRALGDYLAKLIQEQQA